MGSGGGHRGTSDGSGDSGIAITRGFQGSRSFLCEKPLKKLREILNADNDELTTNIQLEEIREACGMSGYDWERKIIKPLKRDLEGDRFKFELLGLLRIDDQVERIRQQALMAPKYQMSSSLIEKAVSAMKQRTQTPEVKALDLDELFDLESEGLSWLSPDCSQKGKLLFWQVLQKLVKPYWLSTLLIVLLPANLTFWVKLSRKGRYCLFPPTKAPTVPSQSC
jgi:hypothetical protein